MLQPLLLSLKEREKDSQRKKEREREPEEKTRCVSLKRKRVAVENLPNFLCTWIFYFMKTVKLQPQDFTDKRKNVDCT